MMNLKHSTGGGNFCAFDLGKEGNFTSERTELFNRATHNSPIRIKAIELTDKIIPEVTFTEVNDTENLDVFETCMKKFVQSKIQWPRFDSAEELLSVLKMMLSVFEMQARLLNFREQHDVQETIDNLFRSTQSQK